MRQGRTTLALVSLAVWVQAVAKNIDLPPEVTVRSGNSRSGDYIDTVTHEARGAAFAKLKLCLAQVVSNAPVTITGGTDTAFAMPSSRTQTSTIQGGDLIKYEDAAAATVIAVGSTEGGKEIMGLTSSVVRFELVAVAGPERTSLRFTNIARATLNTGSVTNEGFMPVGAWKGAKPLQVIDVLHRLGARIDSCLQ